MAEGGGCCMRPYSRNLVFPVRNLSKAVLSITPSPVSVDPPTLVERMSYHPISSVTHPFTRRLYLRFSRDSENWKRSSTRTKLTRTLCKSYGSSCKALTT